MSTLFRFPFAALRGLLFGLLLGLSVLPALAAFTVESNPALIRDTVTGLIWDRCAWGWTWNSGNSSCERDNGIADELTWQQALQAVVAANTASHLGHNDWRLPNIKELESLVDIGEFNPAIDQTFFHWPYGINTGYFWSSTTYASGSASAWVVNFYNGYTNAVNKTGNTFRVRLVRGGQSFDLLMPQPPPPANVAAIPTLGEWATLLLAGLGMAAGWMALRRQRRS